MRKRLSSAVRVVRRQPAVPIAIGALVFAMVGTATATRGGGGDSATKAGAESAKAKKKKKAKVKRGPQGPTGPAGAQGPAGPQGPVGPQGPAGTPATDLWAFIDVSVPKATRESGGGPFAVTSTGVGRYQVDFNTDVSGCSWQVTLDGANAVTQNDLIGAGDGLDDEKVFVTTEELDFAGAETDPVDRDFHIAVFC